MCLIQLSKRYVVTSIYVPNNTSTRQPHHTWTGPIAHNVILIIMWQSGQMYITS